MFDKQDICQLKSEKCSGGNLSKVCIIGMEPENAVGDEMFVIGKAQKPCCFTNINFLSCQHQKRLDESGTIWRAGTKIRPKILIRRKKGDTSKK